MIKPYIAILIDSFWEAVGNKVLWALLIGWTLVLGGLAPFGYVSERSFELTSADVADRSAIVKKLAKAARGQGDQRVQAVARHLAPNFLTKLQSVPRDDTSDRDSAVRISESELARELNVAIAAEDFYSPEDFPRAERRRRLEPLVEKFEQGLSEFELQQLNRELLQLAFPLELTRPRGEQLWIGYAGFKLGEQPLGLDRRQLSQFLEPMILQTVIKLGLGILAVFVAIVVTSPIIPETFRAGSLHLLLSKPISRIWLFITKFFGSCTFILVNITFVLIGLYLIAGYRFDIWNEGLLACIPLLMFVFVIFYSVSALVGLLWGNAIVCVVACMVFWVLCTAVGFMHGAMLPQVEALPQLRRIAEIEGETLAVNQRGDFSVWNEEFRAWQPAFEPPRGSQRRTFGPIYLPERRLIITKSFGQDPFGGILGSARNLSLIRLQDSESAAESDERTEGKADTEAGDALTLSKANPQSLEQAREEPVWSADQGPELPRQMFDIFKVDGRVIAVCRGGLYQLDLDRLDLIEKSQQALFGFRLPFGLDSPFTNVAPPDYYLSENSRAAVTADGKGLVIFNSNTLDHLIFDGNRLKVLSEGTIEGDSSQPALIQLNQQYCVVAREDSPLLLLSSQFEPIAELPLPHESDVRQMAWIPDSNRLSMVAHSGSLLILDCDEQAFSRPLKRLNEHFTCVKWRDAQTAWLGVKPNQALLIDVSQADVQRRLEPQATTLQFVFDWIVKPVYTVNPKPAALDNAMTYLLAGSQTQSLTPFSSDMEAAQLEIEVWEPIISNLLFVALVLAIACIYVARKEF